MIMSKQGDVQTQHKSEIEKINESHEHDKELNQKENEKVIAQHDKEKNKELKVELKKQISLNENKITVELGEHTKQVNDLQQKLSASELKTRTLESQNKSLTDTTKSLNAKAAEYDKMKRDLATA